MSDPKEAAAIRALKPKPDAFESAFAMYGGALKPPTTTECTQCAKDEIETLDSVCRFLTKDAEGNSQVLSWREVLAEYDRLKQLESKGALKPPSSTKSCELRAHAEELLETIDREGALVTVVEKFLSAYDQRKCCKSVEGALKPPTTTECTQCAKDEIETLDSVCRFLTKDAEGNSQVLSWREVLAEYDRLKQLESKGALKPQPTPISATVHGNEVWVDLDGHHTQYQFPSQQAAIEARDKFEAETPAPQTEQMILLDTAIDIVLRHWQVCTGSNCAHYEKIANKLREARSSVTPTPTLVSEEICVGCGNGLSHCDCRRSSELSGAELNAAYVFMHAWWKRTAKHPDRKPPKMMRVRRNRIASLLAEYKRAGVEQRSPIETDAIMGDAHRLPDAHDGNCNPSAVEQRSQPDARQEAFLAAARVAENFGEVTGGLGKTVADAISAECKRRAYNLPVPPGSQPDGEKL